MVAFVAGTTLSAAALNSAFNALTINAQTGTTYTLALSDAGGLVTLTNAAAITLTVPLNATVAFPTGSVVELLNIGAGVATLTPAGGVTVNGSLRVPSLSRAYLVKQATNTWYATIAPAGSTDVLVATSTLSATTSASINNCFSASFENYRVDIDLSAISASASVNLRMRASAADDTTANYLYGGALFALGSGGFTGVGAAATTTYNLGNTGTLTVATTDPLTISYKVYSPMLTRPTKWVGRGFLSVAGSQYDWSETMRHNVSTAFDGLTLYSASNLTGAIRVYGLANS